ncbi:OmpP1/FadL family transporter [Eionea flava]
MIKEASTANNVKNRLIQCSLIAYGYLTLALTLGINTAVQAGGFQLSDHSVTSLGRSHAGYGSMGDDASAAFFNPAGMAILTGQQVQLGLAFIRPTSEFTDIASTGANTGIDNDGGQNTITPNAYFIMPINHQWQFGLALNSPFATYTDYDDNFIGRFSGLTTKITTINLNPSLAYAISDSLLIGFGVSYQTLDATLSGAVSPAADDSTLTIEGDSAAWGYNAGIMLTLADNSRLGLSYRSKVDHDIKGAATFANLSAADDGRFDATAKFTAPDSVYLGYTKPLSEQWTLSLGYRWTRWSRFQELNVLFPDGVASQNSLLVTRWNDSSTFSLGADYILSPRWTLRTGIAFDETPIPDETRTVRTVDSDRQWYSMGASYQLNERLQLDIAYRYIAFDNAPVNQDITRNNTSIGRLIGEYNDVNIHTLAAQLHYRF